LGGPEYISGTPKVVQKQLCLNGEELQRTR